MKEHPILFSTPMVQAILQGRKTQTRRVIKGEFETLDNEEYLFYKKERTFMNLGSGDANHLCPYGQPGDLLWVRETWATSKALDKVKPSNILSGFGCEYKAGGCSLTNYDNLIDRGRWRPSIHMPKIAARIWLQIEEILVEQVQDISEEDAIAEGVNRTKHWKTKNIVFEDYGYYSKKALSQNRCLETAKESFQSLWYSINGIESWHENPWLWVVKYKVLSTTGKPV